MLRMCLRLACAAVVVIAGTQRVIADPCTGFATVFPSPPVRITSLKDCVNNAMIIQQPIFNDVQTYGGTDLIMKTGSPDFEYLADSSVTVDTRSDGFDLHVTMTGGAPPTTTGAQRARLGVIWIGTIKYEHTPGSSSNVPMGVRGFTYNTDDDREEIKTPVLVSGSTTEYATSRVLEYPGDMYSPILSLSGRVTPPTGSPQEYITGISVLYPVLEYQHSVQIRALYNSVLGGWRVGVFFNQRHDPNARVATNPYDLTYAYNPLADLAQGESKSYTIAVRVMRKPSASDHPNSWLQIFDVYRKYFQSKYGLARYTPDYRIVEGFSPASVDILRDSYNASTGVSSNPMGWLSDIRPDSGNGYSNITSNMANDLAFGWKRQMLWSPTGVSPSHDTIYPIDATHFGSSNLRYEFTSHLPGLMGDTFAELGRHSMATIDSSTAGVGGAYNLGLWWGRSNEVMGIPASGSFGGSLWNNDPTTVQVFDQRSATHRGRAFEELIGATEGARTGMIGLDQFFLAARRPWEGFAWLQEMQTRFPRTRFIGEPMQADIFHLIAPTFKLLTDLQAAPGSPQGMKKPYIDDWSCGVCGENRGQVPSLVLPDFLLKTPETWGRVSSYPLRTELCFTHSSTGCTTTTLDPGNPIVLNNERVNHFLRFVASRGYVPILVGLSPTTALSTPSTHPPYDAWSATSGVPISAVSTYTSTIPTALQTPWCAIIGTQPVSATTIGDATTFSVAATSPRGRTLAYQWYFRKFNPNPASDTLPSNLIEGLLTPISTSNSDYSGANTSTLTVENIRKATIGSYQCVVTEIESSGPVSKTRSAIVELRHIADIASVGDTYGGGLVRRDGELTYEDFNVFLIAFGDDSPIADLTGAGGPPVLPDGQLTPLEDFLAFLSAFGNDLPD